MAGGLTAQEEAEVQELLADLDPDDLFLEELDQNEQPAVGPGKGHERDIPFPFPPYTIQRGFMQHLYDSLDRGGLGIFESPTGTGKTMSIICGALAWLKDQEEARAQEQPQAEQPQPAAGPVGGNHPSWVDEFVVAQRAKDEEERRVALQMEQELLHDRLARARSQLDGHAKKKRRIEGQAGGDGQTADGEGAGVDDDVLLIDYESDVDAQHVSSSEDEETPMAKQQEEPQCLKVIFSSRTHSQLSQFVEELKKSPYGQGVRLAVLASRQHMCINPAVLALKSSQRINETCLDLKEQKRKGKKGAKGCPFLVPKLVRTLADQAMAKVQDIEDLVTRGRELKCCPYYAARHAVAQAQVVAAPYNTLLHGGTRRASGLVLGGNVVVIDEAHNLIDAVTNIHSVLCSATTLLRAHGQLSRYLQRYSQRLTAKNIVAIKQLLHLLLKLRKALRIPKTATLSQAATHTPPGTAAKGRMSGDIVLQTINDFVFGLDVENINLFRLADYCERADIVRKMNGFVDKFEAVTGDGPKGSAWEPVVSLLRALQSHNENGRIVLEHMADPLQSTIKFLVLSPTEHFADIIAEARAVVLCGGTMRPLDDFLHQLADPKATLWVPATQQAVECAPKQPAVVTANRRQLPLTVYGCGHVMPPENLIGLIVSHGPRGGLLDFSFDKRTNPAQLTELGQLLVSVCGVVPAGVVVFFPSYEAERTAYQHWEKDGTLSAIEKKKAVFREPPTAQEVDDVLKSYSSTIERGIATGTGRGGLLLSVVGGKLSEGINFKDDMGRCVVMVGLPYANSTSPELQEKMRYLVHCTGVSSAGRDYYENLCMKAVNQSIGRVIRHRNDYACIVLADHRYSRQHVRSKLPEWIGCRVQQAQTFEGAMREAQRFFAQRKAATAP